MFSSNTCIRPVNAITLGDIGDMKVLELVKKEGSSNDWLHHEISQNDIN